MKRTYNFLICLMIGFSAIISSCGDDKKDQKEDESKKTEKTYTMYTVFFGEHPAVMDESGAIISPKFNFTVEITKEEVISKMFGDVDYVKIPYKKLEENDSIVTIEATSLHNTDTIKMTYFFNKKNGTLSLNTFKGGLVVMKPIDIAMKEKADMYATFKLTTDLSQLTEKEKKMLPILFEAAQIMEKLYWKEVFAGDPKAFLDGIKDENMRKYAAINFGPWERLDDNISFMAEYGAKPLGACFYPQDMTKDEYEKFKDPNKKSLYTVIVRAPSLQGKQEGSLKTVFYHEYFKEDIDKAASLLLKAAELAEDPGLKKYLELRSKALLTDDYFESDMAWLDMKTNTIDFVIGPIETYEDALFGLKAAHESFILIKDKEWSKKLEKFTAFLPELQKMLPVDEKYKSETPGSTGNELNAYDVVFYAGDCNAGSKTIAINLPNDEKVRQSKGSRKLQLKNAMKAKFDKILMPIAEVLIDPSQRKYVKFDAFFTNTMFHEVGHGLGCDYVAGKKVTVRDALKDYYTSIEEGKADILGLFIVDKLYEKGELGKVELMDYYVTFMAGIFRSVRFGAASAHGKSNMMRFYYFQEKGAFERDAKTGYYKVNFEKMRQAMLDIADLILTIQGSGDYAAAKKWTDKDGMIKPELQKDLDKVNNSGIPVDIVFEQGPSVLGL